MFKDKNYYVARTKLLLGCAATAPLFVFLVALLIIWA